MIGDWHLGKELQTDRLQFEWKEEPTVDKRLTNANQNRNWIKAGCQDDVIRYRR